MKAGRVYYKGVAAGTIREDENGFVFAYDAEYLAREGAQPVSLTLPLREEPVRQRALDAFYATPRENRPEMTLDEINAEISAARKERR